MQETKNQFKEHHSSKGQKYKVIPEDDDLLPESDFSQKMIGVQGKYVERYREGTNLVLLDSDVAAEFRLLCIYDFIFRTDDSRSIMDWTIAD